MTLIKSAFEVRHNLISKYHCVSILSLILVQNVREIT